MIIEAFYVIYFLLSRLTVVRTYGRYGTNFNVMNLYSSLVINLNGLIRSIKTVGNIQYSNPETVTGIMCQVLATNYLEGLFGLWIA